MAAGGIKTAAAGKRFGRVEAVLDLFYSPPTNSVELSWIRKSVPSTEPHHDNPVPHLRRVEISQALLFKKSLEICYSPLDLN